MIPIIAKKYLTNKALGSAAGVGLVMGLPPVVWLAAGAIIYKYFNDIEDHPDEKKKKPKVKN